jgi:integrase
MRSRSAITLARYAEAWQTGAKAGEIRAKGGKVYKPSVLRSYESALNKRVLPEFGHERLGDITRRDLQLLAERLLAAGHDPSTVRNSFVPLRAIYRRALEQDEVATNPTQALRLPAPEGRRDRVASVSQAGALLDALEAWPSTRGDVPLWATALYAGLRRGELRGLRWEDVDLAAGVIRVCRGWDDHAGEIEPKSKKGTRNVPIVSVLRDYLVEHKLRSGGLGLVFGRTAPEPFTPSAVRRRAQTAWKQAGLEPIGLHECRHTFVSLMFDAGVPLERIGDYVGHSSTYMTDAYRHLIEGHEREAAARFDEYYERADTAARLAQIGGE